LRDDLIDVLRTAEPGTGFTNALGLVHTVLTGDPGEQADALRKIAQTLGVIKTLVRSYQSSVILEAQQRGLPCATFIEAAGALPRAVLDPLRRAYADQLLAV